MPVVKTGTHIKKRKPGLTFNPGFFMAIGQGEQYFNVRLNGKDLQNQTTNYIKVGVFVRNKIFTLTMR
jgi:hypothetical protein